MRIDLRHRLLATAAIGLLAAAEGRADQVAPPSLQPPPAREASTDQVVVTGQRLSTASAIEEKRTAINTVDVISADNLGKLPDPNVADALARLPGVSVINNQDTGEGEYVAIRGLSGTYNAVLVNGVRVAQTDPNSRDVSLNVLPPNGLAAIRVTKTLTPDQDGDAIGGTIDFRTPSAFDFKPRSVIRAYASGGINSQAAKADERSRFYQAQLDLGRRSADDRFGIFVSGNYGVTPGNGQETENDGEWEPYRWRANNEEPIDERNMHLPGIDLDYRRLRQTRYGGNVSLDYRGGATRLWLRGQIARQELRGTNDTTTYRNRPTPRLSQVDTEDTSLVQPDRAVIGTGAKGRIYGYTTGQIVDADRDGVITDADRTASGYWSLDGRSGLWSPEQFQFARNFSTIDLDQTLGTVQFGGETHTGRVTIAYDLSYSGGVRAAPNSYSLSYNCDACTYPLDATGIDRLSPHAPLPIVAPRAATARGRGGASLLPFDNASASRSRQTDGRIAARTDLTWDTSGLVDSVKAGFKYMKSRRRYDYTPLYDGGLANTPLAGLDLAASGLVEKEVDSILRGEYYYGDVYDRARTVAAIRAALAANPDGRPSDQDLLRDDKRNRETIYAGYGLANLVAGEVNALVGARVEHRSQRNVFWSDDGDNSGFESSGRSYTLVLPNLTLNWRPNDRFVARGALWTGYSAPEYGYVAAGQTVGRNPAGEIVSISRGNPDLRPAKSYNADAGFEYYPDRASVIAVAAFYKRIKDFIFTNGSQVNADTQNGTVEISQPQNGETAEIYGVELNVIKSLRGLPSPFDGFGVEGNLTAQHSSAETGIPYRAGRAIRFINTPHLLYNAAITYQKYGVETKLSYNYRGKFIESLRDNAVDKWVRPNRSLDLHTRYNFSKRFALDFDVSNILNDWKYYTTKGDNPSYVKDYLETGTTFLLRGSYVF